MRGCVNRFLLFGLDEDVRDALTDKSECRTTDRHLLHLVALTPQTDLVMMCSCMGSLCNYVNMDHVLSSAFPSACNAFFLTLMLINPTQPTAVPQEKNKEERQNENIKTKEVVENKDENKKQEEKKKSKKESEHESKKGNGKKEPVTTEKVAQVETNKEEGQKKDLNPIVTPVSDDDEPPAGTQKKEKEVTQTTVNATEEEKEQARTAVNISQEEKEAMIQKNVNITQEENEEGTQASNI